MGKAIQKLEDIEVYQESLLLVRTVFHLCQHPSLKKEFALCDQLKRAAISVAANIAEGYGRKTKKDFAQFLSIALGSCNEMIALLDIVAITNQKLDIKPLRDKYQALSKRLFSFRKYLLS